MPVWPTMFVQNQRAVDQRFFGPSNLGPNAPTTIILGLSYSEENTQIKRSLVCSKHQRRLSFTVEDNHRYDAYQTTFHLRLSTH